MAGKFFEVGKESGSIDVQISYRIIQLFSEGLYSSPNKAIEELVSNSFDAGATDVHIILSTDLRSEGASIAVIDNGSGMDKSGLEQHWLIGESDKRGEDYVAPLGRRQIGQFGIGKLATYVLARRLTHLTKVGAKYYSSSMDFTRIESSTAKGVGTNEVVSIPFRELTLAEAKEAVRRWTGGSGKGYQALKLFGSGAAENWTVSVMSDLKEMGRGLQRGKLNWVLSTAMPLREDFRLYMDGKAVVSSKIKVKRLKHLILGRDIKDLPKPAPEEIELLADDSIPKKSEGHYGLELPAIGRISGSVSLYQDPLTGKSDAWGRSYGFFIYVRERLINADDEYFGLDSNLLRHGTFSRCRVRVNIDILDEELRSSRESVAKGTIYQAVQNFLHGLFNLARTELKKHEDSASPGERLSKRVASSPQSLTQWPIREMVKSVLDGSILSRFIRVPEGLRGAKQAEFLDEFEARTEDPNEFVKGVSLEDLSPDQSIALYEAETGVLLINSLHPFVAYHLDAYENAKLNTPLELVALSEVLLEAQLHAVGVDADTVDEVLDQRDETLRYFARARGGKTPLTAAQDLEDSANNDKLLEDALVAVFDMIGFDAVPKGGKGNPDGIAISPLGAGGPGKSNTYRVSLEAKSSKKVNKKVKAKDVGVSGIARNRDKYACEHAIVVGPDFPTAREGNALETEIKGYSQGPNDNEEKKTITLMRIADLARLTRLVPLKRVSLLHLRELFNTCVTPQESRTWIDEIESSKTKSQPVAKVLETIWEEQKEDDSGQVTYSALRVAYRRKHGKVLEDSRLTEICQTVGRVVPDLMRAGKRSVALHQSPENVLKAYRSETKAYAEVISREEDDE